MKRIAKCFGMLTLGLVAGLGPGCKQDGFRCGSDDECQIETIQGFCEDNSYCSFPAADCDSERRYGAQAGDGLAGECVPGGDGGSTTAPETTASTSTTAQPNTTGSSSTTGPDDTTSGTTGPSNTSNTGSESTSVAGSESTTGPMIDTWSDDFDRPNSPSLGNGWIERSPGTFALLDGRVAYDGQPAPYQDSVFYRPFDEALLDLEVSIEFTHVGPFNFSTPQLHTRIQQESLVPKTESINAYIIYLSQPDSISVARIEGDEFALSEGTAIDPPLIEGETYRINLRVTGTDPVEVVGWVDEMVDGTWTMVQMVSMTDNETTRIAESGSFGASGSFAVTFEYDNFAVVANPDG